MDIADMHIGQLVRVPYRRPDAEVTGLGRCYWPGCRYGDECVEIRFVGSASTMNFRASKLTPVEPEGES
jgi:hypothetical protein